MFFPTSEGKIIDTPDDLMAQKKIEFELGAKYKIEERYETIGGCAANVACGLAKLGTDVSCYSHIGYDEISNWIISELEKNKVGVGLITKETNCVSDLSAIIVDKNSADRVIFSNQKANAKLEVQPEKLEGTEWVFIGDLHGQWQEKLDVIVAAAQEKNIRIAYNPRQANIHDDPNKIIQVISFTEVLFLNKDEAIELVSTLDHNPPAEDLEKEEFLLSELFQLGSKIVVITDGLRGAWVYNGEQILHTPGIKVLAVDSTGAGDAFCSGFLASYLKEKTLEECLQWGIANSSNEVQYYGSIEGLLDENSILEKIKDIKLEPQVLNKQPLVTKDTIQ